MSTSTARAAAVALLAPLVLLLHAAPAPAQALSGFAVAATSDQPTFEAPLGFGLSFSAHSGQAAFRTEYVVLANTRSRDGQFCATFNPALHCRPGVVRDELTLHSIRLGGGPRLQLGPAVGSVHGGVSMNVVRGESSGHPELESDLEMPKTGHAGAHLSLSLGLRPLSRIALQVEASALANWIDFDGCRDPDSGFYAPFCGVDRFQELRLGASFGFGG